MKKQNLLLPLIFLSQITFAASDAKKVEPTSEIPAKREFPINTEVNPCEDFHEYVCSIAESRFKLREDRSHHTFAFNDSRERLLDAKKDFMKNLPKEKNLSARGQQIKSYYNSCMDVKSRAKEEQAKVKKVQTELTKIKTAKSFVNYLNSQAKKGEPSFVYLGDRPHLEDPLKLTLYVHVGLMDLPDHTYYEKADVMAAYQSLLTEFFKTVDPNLTAEKAQERAAKQVALQKDFIKTYPVASVSRQRY